MPKTAKSPSLKQSTLSFGAAKRTASSTSTKKPAAKRASHQPVAVDSDSDIDVDDIEISDDEDEVEVIESDHSEEEKKVRQVVTKQPTIVKVTRPRNSPVKPPPRETLPELNENDSRWRTYMSTVRAKRGHLKLIHAEEQDKFHDILRVFDLSYEYGPCVGVSRLERWERASALGLDPPVEVHDILTTRQGTNEESYAQSALYGQV
ncbi:DNA polymerase delta, subunit 4-domain-containing protein [Mycena alexandri]|uniref:DNA polymerase delta, subunit 4-domain-containing protein n=1 Tax=Mycena alexandri TaxID=1745969 RepID=A0AAD6XAD6_9AGAR|nr:DNA polymerase delta, subunit 4-domain-containing protein [Mycena alexandri]